MIRARRPAPFPALALACAVSLLAAACQGPSGQVQGGEPFRPPTAVVQPSAPAQPLDQAGALPSPTPGCSDGLTYLEDETIPDGSPFPPGADMDKRWKVRNSGTCNWDARYRLKLTAGPALGASAEQALYPARAGSEATLRLAFTAPDEPGAYRSAWQAFGPDGAAFGDPIFIDVRVTEATPTPEPD